MKKYILVIVMLVLVLVPKGAEFYTIASSYKAYEYCFYISSEVDEDDFTKVIKNGNSYVGYCNILDAPSIKKRYKVDGESFTTTGTKVTVGEMVKTLSAKIVSQGEVDGIYTIYLYTGRLNTPSIDLFGDKVNVQIALSGNKITVGYPIILGSY